MMKLKNTNITRTSDDDMRKIAWQYAELCGRKGQDKMADFMEMYNSLQKLDNDLF